MIKTNYGFTILNKFIHFRRNLLENDFFRPLNFFAPLLLLENIFVDEDLAIAARTLRQTVQP